MRSRAAWPFGVLAVLLGVLAVLETACGTDPAVEAPAVPTPLAPIGPTPVVVVTIELRAIEGEERRLVEQRALVTAEIESGLSDVMGVVPAVENVPVSPGLSGRVESDADRWRLRVRVDQPERESMIIALELCGTATTATCAALSEECADDPTPAVAALLPRIASLIGRKPLAGAEAMWAKTPSRDRYARLILGRAAATWYRLIPPVPAESIHDRRLDPIERALYIDPRMALGHWIAGRRRFESKDYAGARNAFSRAGLAAPDRVIHLAEEATALAALAQTEAALSAWGQVATRAAEDARFAVPRARVFLAMGRPRDAVALLDALGPRFQGDPRVLELRVSLAEVMGGRPEDQMLLEQWQAADPSSPEPVRRRIALAVRAPALDVAYALVPELERRGAIEEAARLRLALATSLGKLDDAIAAARALGLAPVAQALELRRAIEQHATPATMEPLAVGDPIGQIAVGEAYLGAGDPTHALKLADAVLEGEPWLPEALVLRATALAALGRADEAKDAWARVRAADPGWVRSSTSS